MPTTSHQSRSHSAHVQKRTESHQLQDDISLGERVIQALQATRERVDPAEMRHAAKSAALFVETLEHETDAARQTSAIDRHVIARAEDVRDRLRWLITQTVSQADTVEVARGGALARLPQAVNSDDSPEGLRAKAATLAPLGICDDSSMQSATSPVCSLPEKQRDAMRDFVRSNLDAIGAAWRDAISKVYTDHQLIKIAERDNGSAILHVLLDVALGWVGGELAASVLKYGAKRAGQEISHGAEAAAGAAQHGASPAMNAAVAMVEETGTKLGEVVAKRITHGGHHAVDASTITDMFECVSLDWKTTADGQVRLMTDPALVALGEGLRSSRFTRAFFESKLKRLMHGFDELESGLTTPIGLGGFKTVYVVHRTGAARLALVLDETQPKRYGREDFMVTTGRFHFVGWVDQSLTATALDIARENNREMAVAFSVDDHRWARRDEPELARWARDSHDRDDVQFFSVQDTVKQHE